MKSMEDVQSTLLISNVEDNIVNHMLDKMHGNLESYSERHKRNQASGRDTSYSFVGLPYQIILFLKMRIWSSKVNDFEILYVV